MSDLLRHDPNIVSNPDNNIFGLPTSENDSRVIIIPVPWEVTVSYSAGTARAAESILKASFQIDLFDPEVPDGWKQGYFMRGVDRKILMKSDYLRKEAELYIDYISKGEKLESNHFMSKTLKEVNEGSIYLNNWVYEQTKALLEKNKLVGILGGDHSTPLGYFKAIAEKEGDFGILQIDAHCDLREAYEGFNYSHASVMFNALKEIPELQKLVQIGVRDFSQSEWQYIQQHEKITTYFDKEVRDRQYEGELWKDIADEIIKKLPEKILISFDIDGLDEKFCPHTGTPVPGGFETQQLFFLFSKILKAGKKIVGFDLSEVGVSDSDWDSNVGARMLFKLCNLLVASNPSVS